MDEIISYKMCAVKVRNAKLRNYLNRVSQINMKLSREKCQFRQTEITYLGECLTQHDVKPDADKIKTINDYVKPSNKQDVQRLLGMVNFVAKFRA